MNTYSQMSNTKKALGWTVLLFILSFAGLAWFGNHVPDNGEPRDLVVVIGMISMLLFFGSIISGVVFVYYGIKSLVTSDTGSESDKSPSIHSSKSSTNEPLRSAYCGLAFFQNLEVYRDRVVWSGFFSTQTIPIDHISTVEKTGIINNFIEITTTGQDNYEILMKNSSDRDEITDAIFSQKREFHGRGKSDTSVSSEIQNLAELREEGKITEAEFDAFTEQFQLSSGEKAKEIVQAISELHDEYESGAMTEGNYHSALWSLMDKIDRDT